MSIFVGQNQKPSIIREKHIFVADYRGFPIPVHENAWIPDLDTAGQKLLNNISSIKKIPAIPKIQGR